MPDPLLVSKISLPLMRHSLVPRKKVFRQLSEGVQDGHLLTLVSAPAGYGKTTTVRMWAQDAGYPVAWVTLEKSDNDPKQFLTYFLTALGQAEDDLGHAALELVENTQEVDLKRVLGLLINDLFELGRPVILVLEEYQQIENEKIDQVVESILNQAVANLHLVITTREDPNLPLTRLRVRNQLTEIRAMDLSFSLEETSEFLSNVMRVDLPRAEMEILKNRTEGWVAGLQLAALSLKESGDRTKYVEAFRGTHRHVLDYLIEEVLKSQPEDIRAFLRRTSILEQLSPSLCEAVTGQPASRDHLHYLESNNLFLISLDEEQTWYRYHALFADLLKNQLLQTEPEYVDVLHERAADWYEKNGFIQEAVEHAFQLSSGDTAAKLIERHAILMLYQGEVSIVLGWFDRLPVASIQCCPMAHVGKAWALALMHHQVRRQEVERTLRAADLALDVSHADQALRNLIAGHAASIQAYLMVPPSLTGEEPRKVIETAQKAQHLLPEDEKGIRSVNALNIGSAYIALGDLAAAEKAFQQAFEDGIAGGNLYAAVYGQIDLIGFVFMKGQLKDALQLCETNIDRFNRLAAGKRFPPIGDLYSLKGTLLLEENRLVDAEQALTYGTSLIRLTGEYEARIRGYSALARLRAIQGDRPGMLEAVKNVEETSPEGVFCAHTLHHRLSLRHWPGDPGVQEDARTWLSQSGIEFEKLTAIPGVDTVSMIYMKSYLGAAHVLAHLAGLLPGAYPFEQVHAYLRRLQYFAVAHEFVGLIVEIAIARTMLFHASGKKEEALEMLEGALRAAAPTGLFRIFVDEGGPMEAMLQEAKSRETDEALTTYVNRLLEAFGTGPAKPTTKDVDAAPLSEREIQVLRCLAEGLTYEAIGKQLYLSLNTIQFHVKNIYSKLLVNKRVQAIERAREMKLI